METSHLHFTKPSRGFYRRPEFENHCPKCPCLCPRPRCAALGQCHSKHQYCTPGCTPPCPGVLCQLSPCAPPPLTLPRDCAPWPQTARAHRVSPCGSRCSRRSGASHHLVPGYATCSDQETQKWESAAGSCVVRPQGMGRQVGTVESRSAAVQQGEERS